MVIDEVKRKINLKINYTLTKINQTNENLSITEPQETTFISERENYAFKPKIRFGKQPSKPDLLVFCLLCDTQIRVKYIAPKKQYSQKNNWGYWTKKESNKHKYLCNACLIRTLPGRFQDWGINIKKAKHFHTYLSRGEFKENNS